MPSTQQTTIASNGDKILVYKFDETIPYEGTIQGVMTAPNRDESPFHFYCLRPSLNTQPVYLRQQPFLSSK